MHIKRNMYLPCVSDIVYISGQALVYISVTSSNPSPVNLML